MAIRDKMPNRIKEGLRELLEGFISDEIRAEAEYERAIELANKAGFLELMVGLKQIRKDAESHKDALELMLLGLKSEEE